MSQLSLQDKAQKTKILGRNSLDSFNSDTKPYGVVFSTKSQGGISGKQRPQSSKICRSNQKTIKVLFYLLLTHIENKSS